MSGGRPSVSSPPSPQPLEHHPGFFFPQLLFLIRKAVLLSITRSTSGAVLAFLFNEGLYPRFFSPARFSDRKDGVFVRPEFFSFFFSSFCIPEIFLASRLFFPFLPCR